MALTNKLSAIGDAIREKTGKADKLSLEQMVTEIAGIETGGGGKDLSAGLIDGSLTEYESAEVTSIRASAFHANTNIKTISLPNVVTVNASAFYGCSSLQSVNLPKLNSIFGSSIFSGCTSLLRIVLPSFGITVNQTAPNFLNCSSLEFADFGFCSTIPAGCFNKCTKLKIIVLRKSAVVGLNNVSAFTATPFASDGTGGTVYVPSALIETYRTATNWSMLYAAGTCNFVAIEGSEYE